MAKRIASPTRLKQCEDCGEQLACYPQTRKCYLCGGILLVILQPTKRPRKKAGPR